MSSSSQYLPGDYDAMFADTVRTSAYLAAIARVVRPDDVVVEIGTGVGYFAVAAARAGARHVYAIERDASVMLAEQVVRENALADRITCIHGDASHVALPERGTLLISDLRGMLPLLGDAIPTVIGARTRLLTPHGRLMPVRDTIWASPCEAPRDWAAVELALGDAPAGVLRRSLAVHARANLRRDRLSAESCCSAPALVAELDYATIASPDVAANLEWTVQRTAKVSGIALWFDALLADGIGFSTAPGSGKTVYGHGFLPFEQALDAHEGDGISCRLRAKFADGAYVFAWDTVWTPRGGGTPLAMRQSSLAGMLASPADLARRASTHRPDPARLALSRDLLALADGNRTLAEIAMCMQRAHPERFSSAADALSWVTRRYAALADEVG